MAKTKQKKSSKNLINVLCGGLTAVFGAVILGFLALPHIITLLSGKVVEQASLNGFQLINFDKGSDTGIATVLLLIAIFASLLILLAILKILCDLQVIKNKTVSKVVGFLLVASALILLVLVIVNIITISTSCSAEKGPITGELSGTVAGWGALIGNLVLSVFALICSAAHMLKK